MNGEDDYGEVSQADPKRIIGPVDDENANAADRRERKLMLANHTKRNSLVYSHVLSLITDPNLMKMIQSTPGMQFDGTTYWCPRRGRFSPDTALLADASVVEYFILDCGCTKHSVPNVSDLDTIMDNHPHQSIIVASKQRMPVAAIGTKTNVVTAYLAGSNHEGPGRRVEMKFTNVWAVPGLPLLSSLAVS